MNPWSRDCPAKGVTRGRAHPENPSRTFFMSSPSTGTSTAAWISIWRVYHPQTCGRAHTRNSGPGGRVYETHFRRYVRSPPSSPSSVAAALSLFLSGRPFTIGNLHKRLTEARLNHTREREKNRKASEVFVRGGARVRIPGPRSGVERWKKQRKRKKAQIARGEAAEKLSVEEEEEERWWRDKEGAKALADGGESLRRVARRSYRRYHGGSALSSKSVSSPPALALSLSPLLPTRQIHLRNNTWYTVPRSRRIPVMRYTPSAVTMWLVADHCSTSSFISPSRVYAKLRNL